MRLRYATAPTLKVSPSIMKASNVVSPLESGLPPYPTVPSHCSISHTLHPLSTASKTLSLEFKTRKAWYVALVNGLSFKVMQPKNSVLHYQVFITMSGLFKDVTNETINANKKVVSKDTILTF